MSEHSEWIEKLVSHSADARIAALRKISSQKSVTGVTIVCVKLAGDCDDDVRMWAADALGRSVTPQHSEVDALADLILHSDDGEVCYWAATMLGRLNTDSIAAIEALQHCVTNSMSLPARERAVGALAEIGPAAAAALASLEKTAEAAPARLKRLAKDAIKAIGKAA